MCTADRLRKSKACLSVGVLVNKTCFNNEQVLFSMQRRRAQSNPRESTSSEKKVRGGSTPRGQSGIWRRRCTVNIKLPITVKFLQLLSTLTPTNIVQYRLGKIYLFGLVSWADCTRDRSPREIIGFLIALPKPVGTFDRPIFQELLFWRTISSIFETAAEVCWKWRSLNTTSVVVKVKFSATVTAIASANNTAKVESTFYKIETV